MESADDYEIEEILQAVQADNGGLRTLLLEAIASDIFRSR
jgi:hypothetical protein